MYTMKLDRELYRQAHEWYQQWNQAELIESARNSGRVSAQEAWRQYIGLWTFSMKLSTRPSQVQRRLKFVQWEQYYNRVKTLENWRQRLGKNA